MPQVAVGAAFSALAAGAASGFTAAVLGKAFLASLVLGGLSHALTPKPKKNNQVAQIDTSTVAVNQSDLTRQILYGHTRVTRGYAHMESTGLNGKLHIILMLCEGELRAINEVWVNDYSIPNEWINADGLVTQGRYANKLTIRKHLGEDDQAADSVAVSNMPEWTSDHRLQGIAYLYLILEKDQDIYPTGIPNISAIVEGPLLYDPRIGEDRWTTNISLYAYDYIKNSRYGFDAFDDDIDDDNVAAQANICDEIVETNAKVFTGALESETLNTIELTSDILELCFGDRVRLTGTLPTGLSTGTDYYVIPYQIKGNDLVNSRIQLATTFDNSMAKTAIAISGSTANFTITKTGEPRYNGSGILDTENGLSDNLSNMVTSMAGRAINIGGFWTLLAGAWRTPSVSYDISDMRSSMTIKRGLPMSENFNVIKGLFISPVSFYQRTEYPSVRYGQFIEQDGGIEAPKELNLAFIDRPTAAQRVAKIELFRSRQDIAFQSSFSTKALQNQPGDNIELTVDKLGWEEKYFEITEFSTGIENNAIINKMGLRETAQQVFEWDAGEAIDFDPAPNTTLPNPFFVLAPSGTAYNSRFVNTVADDQNGWLVLSWTLHPDAFVRQFGDFEIQYKLSSTDDWFPSFFVDGSLTQTDVVNSSINTSYDVRIRARNNLGVRSGWVTILGAIVGSSGGIGTTLDWGLVTETPPAVFNDWGSVTDAPTTNNDLGYVF